MTNFKLKPLILFILILADVALIILGVRYASALYWMSEKGWEIKVTIIGILIVVVGILLPIWLGYRYRKSKH